MSWRKRLNARVHVSHGVFDEHRFNPFFPGKLRSPRGKPTIEGFKAALREPRGTTPPEVTPEIAEFCASISQKPVAYVRVDPSPAAKVARCHWNVMEHILKNGGTSAIGWAIWEAPGIHMEAEFHSVWVSPDGEMIDITPHRNGVARVLFLPDPQYSGLTSRLKGDQDPVVPPGYPRRALVDSAAARYRMAGARAKYALQTSLLRALTAEKKAELLKSLHADGLSTAKKLTLGWKARQEAREWFSGDGFRNWMQAVAAGEEPRLGA